MCEDDESARRPKADSLEESDRQTQDLCDSYADFREEQIEESFRLKDANGLKLVRPILMAELHGNPQGSSSAFRRYRMAALLLLGVGVLIVAAVLIPPAKSPPKDPVYLGASLKMSEIKLVANRIVLSWKNLRPLREGESYRVLLIDMDQMTELGRHDMIYSTTLQIEAPNIERCQCVLQWLHGSRILKEVSTVIDLKKLKNKNPSE